MKHSKKYIAFILILCFLFVTKFQILNRDVSVLGKFRGASLDHSLWDPEVSQSSLKVDGYASVMDFHDYAFHSDYLVTVFHLLSDLPFQISRI